MTAQVDLAIVGAGISGLTLARALAARERMPVVYEPPRGVDGRCAGACGDDRGESVAPENGYPIRLGVSRLVSSRTSRAI